MSSVSSLGLSIGRFGAAGGLSEAEAFAAVALAADAGVGLIDCPAEPPGSQAVLGEVLPDAPVFDLCLHASVEDDAETTIARLHASLRRLKRSRVAAVLAHARSLRSDHGPALWAGLLRLRDEGVVGAVGVSACVCDDPAGLALRFRPELMQLPFGLLDQRLLASGALDSLAGAGVEVRLRLLPHAALLLRDAAPFSSRAARLRQVLAETATPPMQAELSFALSRPQASKIVVGVGALADLRALLKAATTPALDLDWAAFHSDVAAETSCHAAARHRAA